MAGAAEPPVATVVVTVAVAEAVAAARVVSIDTALPERRTSPFSPPPHRAFVSKRSSAVTRTRKSTSPGAATMAPSS